MISLQQNTECLVKLGMLKFFPVKESVVAEIGKLLNEICFGDQEARQLTAAVCGQCAEWPGPAKIREIHQTAVASHRFREAEPEGCGLCLGMGYRTVFQVYDERHVRAGLMPIATICEEYGTDGKRQLKEALAQYDWTTHCVYQAVRPCTCELGRVRREARQKLAAQKQGQ